MKFSFKDVLSGGYLNAKLAFLIFLITLTTGFTGFKLIEDLSIIDALYMTIITFSTVGFGTVRQLSPEGKLFASFIILLNIATSAYAVSVFSYYFIEGNFYQKFKTHLINKKITMLTDHIIVCGMGRYGEEIIRHFIQQKMNFVIIEINEDRIAELQSEFKNLLFIKEDATHDDVLLRAGIINASAFITALPDDSDNVFTVLSARQLNPKINIISRAYESKSVKKLKLAGADHVIMPENIGGFYMATLVTKPDAVEFFAFITNEANSDIGFEEITYEELPESLKDKSIRDTNIRSSTGANIIGFKDPSDNFIANPEPDTRFSPGCSFIVLGNREQIKKLKKLIKE